MSPEYQDLLSALAGAVLGWLVKHLQTKAKG